MSLERKKMELELRKVETAKMEMEVRIYEREEDIKRLQDNILIQDIKIEELTIKLKE